MFDLFGRRKMYKKGMEDALHANAAFAQKQQEAITAMREEVRSNRMSLEAAMQMTIRRLGGQIIGLQKYLDVREREVLYKVNAPLDIRNLGNEEKKLLVAVLYQLADEEENCLTENQRAFIRSVQKYLGISNPQTHADLSVVSDIDSLEYQKAFLRVIVEFFYLQDGDEISEAQQDFLGNFSVNKKHANLIEEQVSQLYSIVGPEGIAEKYGFDPTQFEEPTTTQWGPSREVVEKEWERLEQEMSEAVEGICVSSVLAYDFPDYEIFGDEYNSKQSAREAAEKELNKLFCAHNAIFDAYSDRSVAVRAVDSITKHVEAVFERITKGIREFGTKTLCTQASQQMEVLLDYKLFMETAKKLFKDEIQNNSYKYSLQSFSSYTSRIELESDDFETETGFLRLLEKLSVKWNYNLADASTEITNDSFRIQANYAAEVTDIIKREMRLNLFTKIYAVYCELIKW